MAHRRSGWNRGFTARFARRHAAWTIRACPTTRHGISVAALSERRKAGRSSSRIARITPAKVLEQILETALAA